MAKLPESVNDPIDEIFVGHLGLLSCCALRLSLVLGTGHLTHLKAGARHTFGRTRSGRLDLTAALLLCFFAPVERDMGVVRIFRWVDQAEGHTKLTENDFSV